MAIKSSIKLKRTLAGLCVLAASGMAHAQDAALDLSLPVATKAAHSIILAANEAPSNLPASVTNSSPKAEFEPAFFTADKLHQYMGFATLALVAGAALSPPNNGCEANCLPAGPQPARQTNGTHAKLAKAAAAMAAFTVTDGLLTHWDDFHLEDGFSDPDNLHVMLGTVGAAMMLYAVNKSANSKVPVSHAGIAELGGVAMAVAVKLTW